MTARVVEPELLDELSPGDLAARRSRADLRRLNWMMGHAASIAAELRTSQTVRRICDLGSGDGDVMLHVARRLQRRDVELTLVDRHTVLTPETRDGFAELGWRLAIVEQDVFAALESLAGFDAITANLFLHHFQPDALKRLLACIAARTRVFVACEPARSALALAASRSVGLVGGGPVTRHDAVVSVRAGFRDNELSAHWLDSKTWRLMERRAGLFSHLFVAQRQ